jgi:hypothetical protein
MNTYANPRFPNHAEIPSLADISTIPETHDALKPLTDNALVSRTRAGDIGAFEELLGRQPRLDSTGRSRARKSVFQHTNRVGQRCDICWLSAW